MEIKFHLRARALICKNNQILLARAKGENYTFFPGGHIEHGEKAEDALVREINEKLGAASQIKSFLGVIENCWSQEGVRQHEINLIFELNAPDLNINANPVSRENHIEFLWSKIDDLENNNLLPKS